MGRYRCADSLVFASFDVARQSKSNRLYRQANTTETKWHVTEDLSPMDGSKTVVLALDADNQVQGWIKSTTPTLIVRCKEKATEVFVWTGTSANVEGGSDEHTVRLRLDENTPTTEHWSESSNDQSLFAPDGSGLAKQLVGARILTFEFTPFNANPAVARFSLQGLEQHIQKVADVDVAVSNLCHVSTVKVQILE